MTDEIRLANWRPGKVTEPWQREVVLQNERSAIDVINGLCTILFGGVAPGAGPVDFEAQCDVLAKLTGEQIAEALRRYWRITQLEKRQSTELAP